MDRLRDFAGLAVFAVLLCLFGGLLVLGWEAVKPPEASEPVTMSQAEPPAEPAPAPDLKPSAGPVTVDAEPPASREIELPPDAATFLSPPGVRIAIYGEVADPPTAAPRTVTLDQVAATLNADAVAGTVAELQHANADELAAETPPTPPAPSPPEREPAADAPAWPTFVAKDRRRKPAAAAATQTAATAPAPGAAPSPLPKAEPAAGTLARGRADPPARDLVLDALGRI